MAEPRSAQGIAPNCCNLNRAPDAGRAGWVGTRNFEVDSGAYYLSLLFNFHSAVGRARAANMLMQPEVLRRYQS